MSTQLPLPGLRFEVKFIGEPDFHWRRVLRVVPGRCGPWVEHVAENNPKDVMGTRLAEWPRS